MGEPGGLHEELEKRELALEQVGSAAIDCTVPAGYTALWLSQSHSRLLLDRCSLRIWVSSLLALMISGTKI